MTRSAFILGREVRVTATLRDHVLVTLWIIVTFKQFKYDELILYPLALYFFFAFLRDFHRHFDRLVRSLILWLFPTWWLLSVAWGAEPLLILKSGAQLFLTFIICYCAVLRLSARQIMLSVLIAAGWFGILSIVESPSGGIAARGVFSSKNSLGTAMVILWIAAICVALDNGFRPLARLGAAVLALLAVRLIIMSDSATAVLLALASVLIVITVRARSLLNGMALVAILGLGVGAAALLGFWIALAVPEIDPVGYVLGRFGKDTTLTGRTVLWQYAIEEIRRHPWLGIGHGGFWTPEDGLSTASRIYIEFHKKPYANFSFHSSYFEIAVHQGLIGLGFVVAATLWCLARVGWAALTDPVMPKVFFFCVAMVTLARSFTETGLMGQFSLLSMLFTMGALMTLRPRPLATAAPPAFSAGSPAV